MKVIETHPREKGFILLGHCQNILDDPRSTVMISYILVVYAINATIADANFYYTECNMTKLKHESFIAECYMDVNNKNELHTL